jgi:thiamine biosynthesis lipoprotein
MGTTIMVQALEARRLVDELRRLEVLLTRFDPAGGVAHLNRAGRLSDPAPELVAAVRWAVEACRLTDGLVTPLVGRSLEWHGYAGSWSEGIDWLAREGEPPPVPPIEHLVVSAEEIILPPGAALDLGGTAKSWAVQRVAAGRDQVVIDAGGDVLIRSRAPSRVNLLGAAEPWYLELPPGAWAVATSNVTRRAWRGGHHLIDPRTGSPARGRWTQATVVGRSLVMAELATKLLLLGAPVPETLQVEQAWVVDKDGMLR